MRTVFKTVAVVAMLAGQHGMAAQGLRNTASPPIPPRTEEQLIRDLDSAKPPAAIVIALNQLEDRFPTSTNAFPAMRKLLRDSRRPVRTKSARVFGVLHANLDPADIQEICKMLKSTDWGEVIDGLKSLRGLKAPDVVADILPLLKHKRTGVIRDACRTLAVLGNRDNIAAITPLLNHPEADVRKDAQDAIFALKNK
ncbi:MAG: hypothetical protein HY301_15290 [Verrucomicrobia bacterium]|nr:hypothetical protein [Verrucomicrobiota bacterium]